MPENPNVSLNLPITYLDEVFTDVDENAVCSLLQLGLYISLLPLSDQEGVALTDNVKRGVPKVSLFKQEDEDKDKQQLIEEQIELETTMVIETLIDSEEEVGLCHTDDSRLERHAYYTGVLQDLLGCLEENLFYDPVHSIETELNVLLNCFNKYQQVLIVNYQYSKVNHNLWIVIKG